MYIYSNSRNECNFGNHSRYLEADVIVCEGSISYYPLNSKASVLSCLARPLVKKRLRDP